MARKFVCTATEPVVQTKSGLIRGFIIDDIYTFHGIKYADAGRFMQPEPVKPWDGIKDALSYGAICPMLESPAVSGEVLIPHRFWPENEHCQYLNIWTKSIDSLAKKPVMVWLHGGGFSTGSSIEQIAYEGENLAAYGDVVVVTVNHRLNILGYLDMSSFGKKYNNSVNAGMADLVEALKWVRDNISQFGGDPGNVTIFGQSGGGHKVMTLGQIPDAEGLFHRAIVMSGVAEFGSGNDIDHAELVRLLLGELVIPEKEVEKLEKVSFYDLSKAFSHVLKKVRRDGKTVNWRPQKNEWFPGDVLDNGVSDFAKTVPTIVGTVIAEFGFMPGIQGKNEMSPEERREIVRSRYGDDADELIRVFKAAYPDKNEVELLYLDSTFRAPAVKYAEIKSKTSSAPVYAYLFAAEFDYEGGKSAWHCSEIPFFFHNCAIVPIANIEGITDKLEEEMAGAFISFARTGNPNHKNLADWEAFTPDNRVTMVFDRKTGARTGFDDELYEVVKRVIKPFSIIMVGNSGEDEAD